MRRSAQSLSARRGRWLRGAFRKDRKCSSQPERDVIYKFRPPTSRWVRGAGEPSRASLGGQNSPTRWCQRTHPGRNALPVLRNIQQTEWVRLNTRCNYLAAPRTRPLAHKIGENQRCNERWLDLNQVQARYTVCRHLPEWSHRNQSGIDQYFVAATHAAHSRRNDRETTTPPQNNHSHQCTTLNPRVNRGHSIAANGSERY